MHEFILWAAFLGAWALVAGPVQQAMLELRAEDLGSVRTHAMAAQLQLRPPSPPSNWWLLLPPVYFYLRHQRREIAKDQWLDLISDEDFEAMAQFSNKAAAWLMVGFGGLMIALKETWELIDGNEWSVIAFWSIAVVMLMLSISFGVSRMRWMDQQLRKRQARSH